MRTGTDTGRRRPAGALPRWLALAIAAHGWLPAQSPATLQLECDGTPAIAALVQRTANLLVAGAADAGPPDPMRRAAWQRACYWLGRPDLAAQSLRRAIATATASDRPWLPVLLLWHLRATGDREQVRPLWHEVRGDVLGRVPAAAIAADQTAAGDAGTGDLAADVVALHGALCAADLERRFGGAAAAAAERAAWLQFAAFERRFWEPGADRLADRAGAFDPRADHTASLLPCSLGMLLGTGDRAAANARSALDQLRHQAPWPPAIAPAIVPDLALRLCAAAQFGSADGDGGAEALGARATALATAALASTDDVGAALDAVLFALTGLRFALGPGLDEQWLRLRPTLPAGGSRLAVRGLRRDGWVLDLWLERRRGLAAADRELCRTCGVDPDELAAGPAHLSGAVRVRRDGGPTCGGPAPGGPAPGDPGGAANRAGANCALVVAVGGRQFVTEVAPGDSFAFVAPLSR